MSKVVSFSDITKARISKWIFKAQAVDENPKWTERRRAIDFGGHTYLLGTTQVFMCARCGKYDPEWTETEVVEFMAQFDVKPYDIEIECTYTPVAKG